MILLITLISFLNQRLLHSYVITLCYWALLARNRIFLLLLVSTLFLFSSCLPGCSFSVCLWLPFPWSPQYVWVPWDVVFSSTSTRSAQVSPLTPLAFTVSLMFLTRVLPSAQTPLSFKAKHAATHRPSHPGHPTDTSSPECSNVHHPLPPQSHSIWALKKALLHKFAQAKHFKIVLEFALSFLSSVQWYIKICQFFTWQILFIFI